MKAPCTDCPQGNQTMHIIELNDEQFEMLKWVIDNFYSFILQTYSSKDIDNNECPTLAVVLIGLNGLNNIVKNS